MCLKEQCPNLLCNASNGSPNIFLPAPHFFKGGGKHIKLYLMQKKKSLETPCKPYLQRYV